MGRHQRIFQIFIIVGAFFIALNAKAEYYWQDFDDIPTNTNPVGSIAGFSHSVTSISTTTTAQSSPNSIRLGSDQLKYTFGGVPSKIIYWLKTDGHANISLKNSAETVTIMPLDVGGDGNKGWEVWCGDTGYHQISNWATVSNGWHQYTINVNNALGKLTFQFDGGTPTSFSCTYYQTGTPGLMSWSKDGNGYLDNFGTDLNFDPSDVTIIELPDTDPYITVETEELIQFDNPTYCTIGYSCRIWVGYNRNAIGKELILYDEGMVTQEDSIDLSDGQYLKDYLNVPTSAVVGEVNFKIQFYDEDNEENNKIYSVDVKWQNEPTYLQEFFEQYNCETICNDIATSTWWNNLTGDIQCGGRKLVCWGFVPATSTLADFGASVNSFKSNFPFTVINQITEIINDDYTSATSTSIRAGNILPGFNPVLASSTMMSITYGSLWTNIYSLMEYFCYASFFGYIIWRSISIMRNNKEEEKI